MIDTKEDYDMAKTFLTHFLLAEGLLPHPSLSVMVTMMTNRYCDLISYIVTGEITVETESEAKPAV